MPLYLDTRGLTSQAIGICDRCKLKRPIVALVSDPNAPGLRVCGDKGERGCVDQYDPWRLPARRSENITVQYPRPDEPLTVPAPFVPVSTQYTTPGTQSVSVPQGATSVVIEGIASGKGGESGLDMGGGAGAYSSRTVISVLGMTSLYLSVPDINAGDSGVAANDAFVRQNGATGAVLMLAKGGGSDGVFWHGGLASQGVGDVRHDGGNASHGNSGTTGQESGGGAAGPSGNGGNASADGSMAGVGNGPPAGNGGVGRLPGNNYGGGGGLNATTFESSNGAQGWIQLSWS